jgi:hypothetical protein
MPDVKSGPPQPQFDCKFFPCGYIFSYILVNTVYRFGPKLQYAALFPMIFSISCVRYTYCCLQISTFLREAQPFTGDVKNHCPYQPGGTVANGRSSWPSTGHLAPAGSIVGQWDVIDTVLTVLTIIAADLKFSETTPFDNDALIRRATDTRECNYGSYQRDLNL